MFKVSVGLATFLGPSFFPCPFLIWFQEGVEGGRKVAEHKDEPAVEIDHSHEPEYLFGGIEALRHSPQGIDLRLVRFDPVGRDAIAQYF